MLIEKLRITNHPAVGTLELDFRDETGEPARTVVIAGDNGVGKTVALEALHSLFTNDSTFVSQVDADVWLDDEEIDYIAGNNSTLFDRGTRTLHLRRTYKNHLSAVISGKFGGNPFGIANNPHKFAFRTFFSDANVLYPRDPVQRIQPNTLDRENMQAMRSGNAQGVEIPNLLAALRQADLEERQLFEDENPGQPLPPGTGTRRIDRFRRAYEMMMPHKRFRSVRQQPGEYQIVFATDDHETTIHDLSTGEKQIVFRVRFFIRDAGVLQKSVILIDEPELSLSPSWQAKILDFYAAVLNVDGTPHPQIIAATHSPFVVHSATAGKVIVLERTPSGRVQAMPEPMFPEASPPVAIRAFDLDEFVAAVQSGEMAVVTEGKTDHLILATAWEKIYPGQPIPFRIRPGAGAEKLQHLLNNLALPALSRGIVVGLFDFDSAWDRWDGALKGLNATIVNTDDVTGCLKRHPTLPLWAMLLPVPSFRSEMASSAMAGRSLLSIELMFPDAVIPANMKSEIEYPGDQRLPKFSDGCKITFAETVVPRLDAADFEAFRPLFGRLLEIQRDP